MSQEKKILKPLTLAIGATFVASMAASSFANAAQSNGNPFAMHDMNSGYTQLAEMQKDGKCGTGKCGANVKKPKDGKCGDSKQAAPKDGKCGANKQAAPKEGQCGANKQTMPK